MQKANNDIREAAHSAGVKLGQIANRLNLNDGNFSRKLRCELPADEKAVIHGIIAELEKEREASA